MDDVDELLAEASRRTPELPQHVVDGLRRICEANDARSPRERVRLERVIAWMARHGVKDAAAKVHVICRSALGRKSFSQP